MPISMYHLVTKSCPFLKLAECFIKRKVGTVVRNVEAVYNISTSRLLLRSVS